VAVMVCHKYTTRAGRATIMSWCVVGSYSWLFLHYCN